MNAYCIEFENKPSAEIKNKKSNTIHIDIDIEPMVRESKQQL